MPNKHATNTIDPDGWCDGCGQRHASPAGRITCHGHVTHAGPGIPLDEPRPCKKFPRPGMLVCPKHGGSSPQAIAAADRKLAEQRAEREVRRLIPDDATPITDPIAVLARMAGEADAFRAAVARLVKDLDAITLDDAGQLHAYVALYERAVDRTVRICEALVRSNYLERHAAVEEAEAVALLAAVQGGLRLIDDTTLRQAVTVAISDGVRALAG